MVSGSYQTIYIEDQAACNKCSAGVKLNKEGLVSRKLACIVLTNQKNDFKKFFLVFYSIFKKQGSLN